MRRSLEFIGDDFDELVLDFADVSAGRDARSVRHAEHMRVDGDRRFAVRGVEYDVCGFAADAG